MTRPRFGFTSLIPLALGLCATANCRAPESARAASSAEVAPPRTSLAPSPRGPEALPAMGAPVAEERAPSRGSGGAPSAPASGETSGAAAPALPKGIEPGVPTSARVPQDKAIIVIHGAAGTRRAIVYLHGVCGNVAAIYPWAQTASHYGTVLAIMGDRPCPDGHRFKWTQDTLLHDIRIDRAVKAVSALRGGQLDTARIALVGYSQGATRVAALVQRFPEKYPWVLAAGAPVEPKADRVGLAQRIVVMGGEKELTTHMRRGFEALVSAGKTARYFELPGARHGEFGPEGSRVMDEAFAFLFAE